MRIGSASDLLWLLRYCWTKILHNHPVSQSDINPPTYQTQFDTAQLQL